MEQERQQLISIGAFASESRLSHKALRLYATLSLLVPRHVAPDTGYRYYHPDQLRSARRILLLREMDLPLATIRQVLAATPEEAEGLVRIHLQARAARLERARQTLSTVVMLLHKENAAMSFEITVRDAAPQPVLMLTRRVTVDALIAHITGSLQTLYAALERQRVSPAGPSFGIYTGPVNHEDDGPISVCVPVPQLLGAEGEIEAHALPAARLACVTLRGSQCDFPAILEG